MADVVLINPPFPQSIKTIHMPPETTSVLPLGLAYLAAALEAESISVEVIDMGVERLTGADVVRRASALHPRVVGISSLVTTHRNGLRLAAMLRSVLKETLLVMGGPHATFVIDETLAEGMIDVVCRAEAEASFLNVVCTDPENLSAVPGIAIRSGQEVIVTPEQPPILDLNSLPFPARHLFPVESYAGVNGASHLVSGRGCPFGCVFCSAGALHGKKYRTRSPENVVAELELLSARYGMRDVFFADDTFTVSQSRVEKICSLMMEHKLDLSWGCEARVDTVTGGLLYSMKQSGCSSIQFGVESGDEQVLAQSGKGITIPQIFSAVESAANTGIEVACSLIIGHPTDTEDSVKKTLSLARDLVKLGGGLVKVKFALFTPLPGTPAYLHAKESGLKVQTTNWDHYDFSTQVAEIPFLSEKRLRYFFSCALSLQQRRTDYDW